MQSAARTLKIFRGHSNLKRWTDPLSVLAELSVEGARRFGDDPKRIAAFIESELAMRPEEETRRFWQGVAAVTVGEAPNDFRH